MEKRKRVDGERVWTEIQHLALELAILGQATTEPARLVGQGARLASNVMALARDSIPGRPMPDKVKDACMCGLTIGLIVAYIIVLLCLQCLRRLPRRTLP